MVKSNNPGFIRIQEVGVPHGVATFEAITEHEKTRNHLVATQQDNGFLGANDKTKLDGIQENSTKNSTDSQLRNRSTHIGTQPISSIDDLQTTLNFKEPLGKAFELITIHESSVNHPLATFLKPGLLSPDEKTKLSSIQAESTKNSSDTFLRNRSNHTGTQNVDTITGLGDAALRNIGNTAGTVAAGDDSRFSVINLNNKKHTRGTNSPSNPQIGDTWDELSSTDQFIETWFWNGSYWLSTRLFIKEPSLVNIGSNTQAYYELPQDNNVFVVNFKVNILLGNTNTTNSNWTFIINRVGNNTVALANISSANSNANTWFTSVTPVNTHINILNTASKAFRFDINKNNVASNIVGSILVSFRLARL